MSHYALGTLLVFSFLLSISANEEFDPVLIPSSFYFDNIKIYKDQTNNLTPLFDFETLSVVTLDKLNLSNNETFLVNDKNETLNLTFLFSNYDTQCLQFEFSSDKDDIVKLFQTIEKQNLNCSFFLRKKHTNESKSLLFLNYSYTDIHNEELDKNFPDLKNYNFSLNIQLFFGANNNWYNLTLDKNVSEEKANILLNITIKEFPQKKYFFSYCIFKGSGFFGYFFVFFGLFNLVYSYNNQNFTFIIYGIIFVFKISEELFECLAFYNININDAWIIIIIISSIIAGGVTGFFSNKFTKLRKIFISFFLANIAFYIFFCIVAAVSFQNTDKNFICFKTMLIIKLITIVVAIVFYIFFIDEEKHKMLKLIFLSVIGSYHLILGMNYIGGGLPFIPFIYDAESLQNVKYKMVDQQGLGIYFGLFVGASIFGVFILYWRREDMPVNIKDDDDIKEKERLTNEQEIEEEQEDDNPSSRLSD